jgi:hypothetical protein
MTVIPDDAYISDLPCLGMKRNALRCAGYATAGDLRAASDAALMMHPGIGPGTVNKIRLHLGRERVGPPRIGRDELIEQMARALAQKAGWFPWEALQESEAHGESVLGRKEFREAAAAALSVVERHGLPAKDPTSE